VSLIAQTGDRCATQQRFALSFPSLLAHASGAGSQGFHVGVASVTGASHCGFVYLDIFVSRPVVKTRIVLIHPNLQPNLFLPQVLFFFLFRFCDPCLVFFTTPRRFFLLLSSTVLPFPDSGGSGLFTASHKSNLQNTTRHVQTDSALLSQYSHPSSATSYKLLPTLRPLFSPTQQ